MDNGPADKSQQDADTQMNGELIDTPNIKFEKQGAAAIITLDRPKVLNALNDGMRAQFPAHLDAWAPDSELYCMIIQSANQRAFCVGGDVRELYAKGRAGNAMASLEQEYKLNWRLDRFTKPTISLINGMVMGSGVGISRFGTHTVAGENYSFAMPEVAIGFFPDVGASWFLSHLSNDIDGAIGIYLGLTGRSIKRADAYALGLVTHAIEEKHFPAITAALADADPIDPIVDGLHVDPGESELLTMKSVIAECFSATSVEEIIARVKQVGGKYSQWRDDTLEAIQKNSPTSLKVTLKQLRLGRDMDLRRGLQLEYRLATRFMAGHDFYEGVRANLIEKDFKPAWLPPRLSDVTEAMVEEYFVEGENPVLNLSAPSDQDLSNN